MAVATDGSPGCSATAAWGLAHMPHLLLGAGPQGNLCFSRTQGVVCRIPETANTWCLLCTDPVLKTSFTSPPYHIIGVIIMPVEKRDTEARGC